METLEECDIVKGLPLATDILMAVIRLDPKVPFGSVS